MRPMNFQQETANAMNFQIGKRGYCTMLYSHSFSWFFIFLDLTMTPVFAAHGQSYGSNFDGCQPSVQQCDVCDLLFKSSKNAI